MNITSLTPTVNSLECTELNETATYFMAISLTTQDTFNVIDIACMDEGTEYEVTISYQPFVPQNIIFEADSVSNHNTDSVIGFTMYTFRLSCYLSSIISATIMTLQIYQSHR